MKKFNAFTLAEVLITLGIIGVVAAMTMPTLMNQTNGAQYKAAYKKALSAISQGVTLNVALDGGSFADAVAGGGTSAATDQALENSIANILSTRMNVVNASNARSDGTTIAYPTGVTAATLPTVNTFLYFNDGSMFAFNGTDTGCKAYSEAGNGNICKGYIDVNGSKGPNKVVVCDTAGSTTQDTIETNGKITAATTDCTVTNPTDVYPVFFYDQTIIPSTNAAKAVLYGK